MFNLKALALIAMGVCFSAQAQTITLQDTGCTATRMCYAVPNDAGADVFINANASTGSFNATIDGVNYHGVGDVSSDFTLPACSADGVCLMASARWKHWTTRVRSGHNLIVQHWELLGGSLVFP